MVNYDKAIVNIMTDSNRRRGEEPIVSKCQRSTPSSGPGFKHCVELCVSVELGNNVAARCFTYVYLVQMITVDFVTAVCCVCVAVCVHSSIWKLVLLSINIVQ